MACRQVMCFPASGSDVESDATNSDSGTGTDSKASQVASATDGSRRRVSTMTLSTEGTRLRSASRFRLRSRTDVQQAVTWMEGEEHFAEEEEAEDDERLEEEEPAKPARQPSVFAELERSGLLPLLLVGSGFVGAACMLTLQRSLVEELCGSAHLFTLSFSTLYAAALSCMVYVALSDPGQLREGVPQPQRSHKSWQYERPVLRFDHYCRWVTNCIGLANHREFMAMLVGFVAVALAGGLVDVVLLYICFLRGQLGYCCALLCSFLYQAGFAYYVAPIFRLHVGFVSRNELANEWKHDLFYVVPNTLTGEPIWVGDLDVDEFNERFDEFQYDPTRNPFDKGCLRNCCAFWWTPRWTKDQLGEF